MIVRCACGRHIGVGLGRDEGREEIAGLAALMGTCERRRGNAPCDAAQRYEELKTSMPHRLAEAECP